MPFTFRETQISGVILIEAKSFPDERGFFVETYKGSEFERNGISFDFPQDNKSYSIKGVIRGLHYQMGGSAQGKLVSVPSGRIYDVAIDLRKGSDTYGKYVAEILSSDNNRMLWLPPGFAHGFQALENSIVNYKVTSEYAPGTEGGIIWSDPDIGVEWPIDKPILSDKDKQWPTFDEIVMD